jgi:hypothetical protein
MSAFDDGGYAFPKPSCDQMHAELGMTLRDYFAAAALQGLLAYSHVNPMRGNYHENNSSEGAATASFQYADAMLAARAKTQENLNGS